MSAQKGALLLFRISNGDSPETFDAVMEMRTDTMKINEETVDITAKDHSNRWRELLRGGIRDVEYSGDGIFKDSAAFEKVRANVMDTSDGILNFQVFVPDFGTFEMPMVIDGLQLEGEYQNAVMQEVTAKSAGEVTFATA